MAAQDSCPDVGMLFLGFVFFFFVKDVLTKKELQKGKRKEVGKEKESLHTALPDGRYPSPGSFSEV